MTKPIKKQLGFTLIEVLVVVSILLVMTSLLIPRLRIINQERSLRETARVTGSLFAQASQRAIADGSAGVVLQYNPNFADGTGFAFGVSNMSLLRAVPPFTGDQAPGPMIGAYRSGTAGTVTIPVPLEQVDLEIIKSGDKISFGQSSVRYTINTVMPGAGLTLDLALEVSFLPDPNEFVEDDMTLPGTAYAIHRLPRILGSSEVELPPNYIVDMRFSGFTMLDSGFTKKIDDMTPSERRLPVDAVTGQGTRFATTVFEPNPGLFLPSGEVVDFTKSNIAILFNERGELDRMVRLGIDSFGNTHVLETLAVDSLRLFVGQIDATVNTADPADNPLNSSTNLWVTVNRSTGNINVGYNQPDNAGTTLDFLNNTYFGDAAERTQFNGKMNNARGFAAGQTAAQ